MAVAQKQPNFVCIQFLSTPSFPSFYIPWLFYIGSAMLIKGSPMINLPSVFQQTSRRIKEGKKSEPCGPPPIFFFSFLLYYPPPPPKPFYLFHTSHFLIFPVCSWKHPFLLRNKLENAVTDLSFPETSLKNLLFSLIRLFHQLRYIKVLSILQTFE